MKNLIVITLFAVFLFGCNKDENPVSGNSYPPVLMYEKAGFVDSCGETAHRTKLGLIELGGADSLIIQFHYKIRKYTGVSRCGIMKMNGIYIGTGYYFADFNKLEDDYSAVVKNLNITDTLYSYVCSYICISNLKIYVK